jgi:hypothetical protein
MAKLRAPANGAPVHWRGKIYEIRADGSVQVPDEAAAALLAHGFTPWPGDDLPRARRREG